MTNHVGNSSMGRLFIPVKFETKEIISFSRSFFVCKIWAILLRPQCVRLGPSQRDIYIATCGSVPLNSYQSTWSTGSKFCLLRLTLNSGMYIIQVIWCCLKPFSQWCCSIRLTHLPLDKMAAISQTLSNAFSWMKMGEFRLNFHWSLFLRVQLTIFQHWFR